jgi:hypothetical protein
MEFRVSSVLVTQGVVVLLRHVAAAVSALVLAAGIGLLAGAFGSDQFVLRAVVFGACTLGPAYGLAWLVLLGSGSGPAAVGRPEETIEHVWWQRSAAGSFLDLIVLAGVGSVALAVTGVRMDAGTILAALLVSGLADVTVRLSVLRRRDA